MLPPRKKNFRPPKKRICLFFLIPQLFVYSLCCLVIGSNSKRFFCFSLVCLIWSVCASFSTLSFDCSFIWTHHFTALSNRRLLFPSSSAFSPLLHKCQISNLLQKSPHADLNDQKSVKYPPLILLLLLLLNNLDPLLLLTNVSHELLVSKKVTLSNVFMICKSTKQVRLSILFPGYPMSDAEWVPTVRLDCPDILSAFIISRTKPSNNFFFHDNTPTPSRKRKTSSCSSPLHQSHCCIFSTY